MGQENSSTKSSVSASASSVHSGSDEKDDARAVAPGVEARITPRGGAGEGRDPGARPVGRPPREYGTLMERQQRRRKAAVRNCADAVRTVLFLSVSHVFVVGSTCG